MSFSGCDCPSDTEASVMTDFMGSMPLVKNKVPKTRAWACVPQARPEKNVAAIQADGEQRRGHMSSLYSISISNQNQPYPARPAMLEVKQEYN
eukprot:1153471-Pelagomonas_calceolata.AAC.2